MTGHTNNDVTIIPLAENSLCYGRVAGMVSLVHTISKVANVQHIKKFVKVCSELYSLLHFRSTCKLSAFETDGLKLIRK